MLKKKDAQGMSIKMIVLAIIALIILVVLLGIFSGNIGNFIETVKGVFIEEVKGAQPGQ